MISWPSSRHLARPSLRAGADARRTPGRPGPTDLALEWITEHGDKDGDGYVEYQRTTDRGLRTRVGRTPGTRCASPTARSRRRRSRCARCRATCTRRSSRALRDRSRRSRARGVAARRADELKRRFNADFWVDTPDGGYFALGLDRDKRPIDGIGSNMGHCLWTGIVDEEKAPHVARAALGTDVQRVGHPHALEGHRRVQPGVVPLRRRVAARQRDLRGRSDALRLRRGGAPRDARAGRRVAVVRRSAPRAVLGHGSRRARLPGELPDVVLAAGVGRRVAAAVPADAAALRARHPQLEAAPGARFPTGSARCGSTTSRSWAVSSRSRCTARSCALQVPDGLTIVSDPPRADVDPGCGVTRWARESPSGSVHHRASCIPAVSSSSATCSRVNLALTSVRISSPAANGTDEAERAHLDRVRVDGAQPHLDARVLPVERRRARTASMSKSASSSRFITVSTFLLNSAVTPCASS